MSNPGAPGQDPDDPLERWQGNMLVVMNNLRMMPNEVRQAALVVIARAFCPECGFERHPLMAVCPCVRERTQ